ncbi:MAG TPA: hypothetical protein VGR63_14285 [Casimicrobiaceae bacterium]|jgi:hypothetical protein|nr:hypothetical protein [Casimicrobiaceae bacterium]
MKKGILASLGDLLANSVADWRQLTVMAFLGVTLAACAGLGGVTKESPQDKKVAAVTSQVEARWAALIAGDPAKSYSFLSVGSQSRLTLEQYRAKARLTGFRAAKIEKVECEAEICRVSVRVTLDTRKMKGLPMPETESWILEGGEYRFVWPL